MKTKTNDYHQAYVRLRSQPSGKWLVHPDLRDRLVGDAVSRETNITEVASRILADRFGVAYTSPGRRTAGVPQADAEILNMRIPLSVWKAIERRSIKTRKPKMTELRHALCAHYELPIPA